MKSVRILPVLMVAVAALFVLKTAGLLTEGRYVLGGSVAAVAEDSMPPEADEMSTENVEATDDAPEKSASEQAADALFDKPVVEEEAIKDAVPVVQDEMGQRTELASADGVGLTERAILERLGERRTELDSVAAELELRLALVEAAERRLDERVESLKSLEAQITALVEEKKSMNDVQFASLVGMYENMKSASAATVFNQLDMGVLVRIARHMNPRKMAPILAKMVSTRAQELTVRLASAEVEPTMTAPLEDLSALPQIVGQ